jgi:hypothetical protein
MVKKTAKPLYINSISLIKFFHFLNKLLIMNKQVFFFALFISITSMVSAATFTVNNNNPSPGQYTTIDAAMSAAADGDVILINGSPTTYQLGIYVSITKSLTFIGTGYDPQKDNPLTSNFSFYGGVISAPNVTFKGIVFTNNLEVRGSNATFSECYFNSIFRISNVTGLTLRNNVFAFSLHYAIYFVEVNSSATPNIVFENNIFTAGAQFYNNHFANGVVLRNNVFLANSAINLSGGGGSPINWTFQNNIFWNVAIATETPSSAFINNISYSPEGNTNVPITNGGMNVGNINANPQFINYSGGGFSSAHNYRLQAASPGHLAGTDGIDIGAFGGATPHTDHGMPNIPVMKVMNITGGAVPVGGTIQVTFQSTIQN